MRDHPRLCGEKHHLHRIRGNQPGSPPPMRGKANHGEKLETFDGITPAYAGKSGRFVRRMHYLWDHPRLCGEKHSTFVIRSKRLGSPPPMRGKACLRFVKIRGTRITPAYAGKSSGCCRTQSPYRDHPRLCGEKNSFPLSIPFAFRITPAYAGKRSQSNGNQSSKRDHPRLCGEKLNLSTLLCMHKGSPPPMRGKALAAC